MHTHLHLALVVLCVLGVPVRGRTGEGGKGASLPELRSDGALSKPTPHPPGPRADPTAPSEPRNPCTLGAAGESDCHLLCDRWGSRWAGHGPVWGSSALTMGWMVHSSPIVPS